MDISPLSFSTPQKINVPKSSKISKFYYIFAVYGNSVRKLVQILYFNTIKSTLSLNERRGESEEIGMKQGEYIAEMTFTNMCKY